MRITETDITHLLDNELIAIKEESQKDEGAYGNVDDVRSTEGSGHVLTIFKINFDKRSSDNFDDHGAVHIESGKCAFDCNISDIEELSLHLIYDGHFPLYRGSRVKVKKSDGEKLIQKQRTAKAVFFSGKNEYVKELKDSIEGRNVPEL